MNSNNEELQIILEKQGDARGAVFQTDANYILEFGSQDNLLKIEEQLKEWGLNFHYKDIKPMSWYPVAWRVLSLLSIKKTMNWDDTQIGEMGKNAPKVSIIVKLFFKLFPDIKKFAEQIPAYWRKHYTVGDLEVAKLDNKHKEMILHLKNYSFHPILCKYLEGYFETATKLTRPQDSVVSSKEIKCSFRDNIFYEVYQLKWTK